MSIKRLFFNAVLACSVFMILGAGMAMAADMAVTNTDPAATVGVNVPNFAITIDVAAAADVVNGNTFTLSIPPNLPSMVMTDLNDGKLGISVTIGGHNVCVGDDGVTCAIGGGVLTITVADVTDMDGAVNALTNGDDVVISFTTAADGAGTAVATYASSWNISGSNLGGTHAGAYTYTGVTPVVVSAAAAGATATLTPATVGDAMSMSLSLTLPVAMGNLDTISFTAPSSMVVSAPIAGAQTFGGAGAFSCAAVGQLVTCTADGVINAGAGTLAITGIYSKYTDSTDLSTLVATDTGNGSIATTAAPTLTNMTVGALATTNVEPALITNSTYTQATVTFTASAPIINTGVIKVTFPTGWNVAAVTSGTAVSGISGALTVTNSGQVVTVTVTTGAAATPAVPIAVSFTLNNVLTPAGTGSAGTYTIATYLANGTTTVETDAAVTADTIYAKSTTASVTIGTPTGLTVTDNPDGDGVVLTWTDPSGDDSASVDILRGVSPVPVNASAFATVAIGTETYTDTDLSDGDVVTYQLRAYGEGSDGDITSAVTFTVGSGETVVSDDTTTGTTTDEGTTDETTDEGTTDEGTTDTGTTSTTTLTDVTEHWAADEITYMVEAGIVQGDPEGTFRPDDSLNRAEAATLLHRVLGIGDPADVTEDPFSDVAYDAWYAPYVAALLDLALIAGNPDGTYEPGEEINRAEFLTLAMNVYEFMMGDVTGVDMTDAYVDLDTTAWYAQTVSNATYLGFVSGSAGEGGQYFNAASSITRAEATTILYRMFAVELASR